MALSIVFSQLKGIIGDAILLPMKTSSFLVAGYLNDIA